MKHSEDFIKRVAAASDIVDLVGGYFPIMRTGTSWRALCPFHREKSPSFHVSPQKQAYYCFGCGSGGSVFKFVMEYERVDFHEAVDRIALIFGVSTVTKVNGWRAVLKTAHGAVRKALRLEIKSEGN